MKTGTKITLTLALVGACGGYFLAPYLCGPAHAEAESAADAPALTPAFPTELWADAAALEKKLAADILARLKGTDEADVRAFLGDPAKRLMLVQWMIAHCEKAVDTSQHAPAKEGERIIPRSLKELCATADAATMELLTRITNDAGWMEQLAYTGECIQPGRAIALIVELARKHPELLHDRVLRDIATATAIEWARSGWDSQGALARADFYIRNHKAKRFHKGFKSLPFWHYRIICGSKGNNANGSVASLEWALDNVHLPIEQYSGACWQAAYLSTNLFGDSIHGPYYYAPYDDVYGQNAIQRSKDVGGVCGSLSHFGAFAAIANGVPAMTAGEPGHCAYIVCENGRWVPSYSLSWQRGLHWHPWNGNDKYSSLHMASELYAPGQAAHTALSEAFRTLAELYVAEDKGAEALACLRHAVEVQPCNYLAWSCYASFLQIHRADNAKLWKQLYKEMSRGLAPRYPEMAAMLLLNRVHAGMHRACPASDDRMECYSEFWRSVKGMGPDRWAVEGLCDSQAGSLQDAGRNAEEAKLAFYQMALGHAGGNAAYAPVILSWGNGHAGKMGGEMQKRFLGATLSGLGKGGDMNESDRDNMLGQALQGAERMRDRSSFQAIGRMLSAKYRNNRLPKWQPFPGKLVSQEGMIYVSSLAHDTPAEHWGVLQPTGGRFHTASEKDPWVVVELPRTVFVTGVVAISTAGWNNRRLNGMKVQYSETGRDDDWHEAGAFPQPSTHEVNRLDLGGSRPRARFIRIVRSGGPDVFHLNGIFVYGEQAS